MTVAVMPEEGHRRRAVRERDQITQTIGVAGTGLGNGQKTYAGAAVPDGARRP